MITDGTFAAGVEAFLRQAVDGDGRAGTQLAIGLLDRGVPGDQVIVKLLGAAQREVGERWLTNDFSVADEHLVSGSTQRALDAVANTLDPPAPTGLVIVACAQGDWHSLPAQMFAELLRLWGFEVLFLGASTPADHVADLMRRRRADALAISCHLPIFLRGVTSLADAAHREGVPVVVGGRALGKGPMRATRLGADAWASGIDGAVGILRDWQRNRPPQAMEPTKLDRAALELDLDSTRIAAEAFESLSRTYPGMAGYDDDQLARTSEDLGFITRFIAAARLVADAEVFTDFIGWLGKLLAHRGVPHAALEAGLAALAPVLQARDPQAGKLARDALAASRR